MWFSVMLSYSAVCLFIPLVVFLEEQKFLILMKSIFLFYSLWFLVIVRKGFSGNSAGKESARNGGEKPQFDFWVGKICWRRDRLPTPVFLGFPGSSVGKESICSVGSLGGEDPMVLCHGGEHGNPLQYSSLENPQGRRGLAGYSPWGHKVSDTTERLSRSTVQEIFAWPRSQSFSPVYF